MAARILDGPSVAAALNAAVMPDVQRFTAAAGRPPGLGIVLVGDDPASEIYVRNKVKAGGESGLRVELVRLPATATLDELLGTVDRLNRSPEHDGILVQSPLPPAMGRDAAQRVFDAIDPAKDVDGFSPGQRRTTGAGTARISRRARRLASSRCSITSASPSRGARAVVIGRSDIVGKPMAMLLLHRDATVTICHSKTPAICRRGCARPTSSSRPSGGRGSSRASSSSRARR